MIRVVDASALVDAVLPTERQEAALAAMRGHDLWAPAILDLEVCSALWRLARAGAVTEPEAEVAVRHLRSAPVRRLDLEKLVDKAWGLRKTMRVSDAFYVAAALLLRGDLLTSDARLSRTPDVGVTVTLLR